MTFAQRAMAITVAILFVITLLVAGFAASVRARHNRERGDAPLDSFFTGGRRTGAFVLAMTVLTTYLSASSFLGGPGYAYEKGLSWVYLSVIQVPVIFLTFGVLGKKLGIISRKINGVTVNDILRVRYESAVPVILCSVLMIFFYVLEMTAQLKGGAILFRTITGLSYETALLVFMGIVVLLTVLGGFTGQSIANTIFGIFMLIGCLVLWGVLTRASGNGNVAETMTILHPGWDALDGADGSISVPYMLSFWVLTGLGVLGLPQTAVAGLCYRNTKALNRAIPIGTVLLAFIVLTIHIVGTYSPLLISMPEIKAMLGESAGTDYIIPGIILKYVNPLTAGLFFAAPLAAILSSVNAMLLSATASLVKDIYVNYILRDKRRAEEDSFRKRAKLVSFFLTAVLIAASWLLLRTERVAGESIVSLNLLAMGGLEVVFFFPLTGGLFWRRGNAAGAVMATVSGVALYTWLTMTGTYVLGFMPVVPSLLLSGVLYFIVSLFGKKTSRETLRIFFPPRQRRKTTQPIQPSQKENSDEQKN